MIVIIGAGGLGRETLKILNASGASATYFADDNSELHNKKIEGLHVMSIGEYNIFSVRPIIAIGNNRIRKEIVQRLDIRTIFYFAIHPRVTMPSMPFIFPIGYDIIINAGTVLTDSSIYIGNHVHIDAGCILSHDVVLKDYVRLNPGVTLCGNVTIEEGAYIGAGATIKEGVRIGAWSIIGMGSVVLNDVSANAIVFGVPAR